MTFLQKLWAEYQAHGHTELSTKGTKRPFEEVHLIESDVGKGADGRKAIISFYATEVPRRFMESHDKDPFDSASDRLSFRPFVRFVRPTILPSVRPFVRPSDRPPDRPTVPAFVRPTVRMSVRPSVRPPAEWLV